VLVTNKAGLAKGQQCDGLEKFSEEHNQFSAMVEAREEYALAKLKLAKAK